MKTESQIRKHIFDLRAKIERLEHIANAPMKTPGPFMTGRSNYTLGKRLDAENERKSKAFRELQQAQKDLAYYSKLLQGYLDGECHLNGQPRSDAPSKQRWHNTKEKLAEFMRDRISKGDSVAVAANPDNKITVKRVNRKSVTSETGSLWNYDEILLLDGGEAMEHDLFIEQFVSWLNAQAS